MKRIALILAKLFAVCAALGLCILLYLFSVGYFDPQPAIGYLHSPKELPYVDLDALEDRFAENGVRFLLGDESAGYEPAARELIEQGAQVLIVSEDEDILDPALLRLARRHSVPLVVVGRSPQLQEMEDYDKLWYVGSNPALGGELLGEEMAMGFRDGTIADANGDLLLQYSLYLSDIGPYHQALSYYALQECEHYGVYSNLLEYLDENDDPLPFTAEALAGQQKPELLLCTTAGDARFLYDLAEQLGWLEGDAPVRIAAVAENPELAQALVNDGVAVAASYYDIDQITQVAGQLALNALDKQFAGQGLELQPDETGRFFIPFGLVTTIEDE
ncbi:LacI family DNA-binding transcriptional regulator [Gemmiger sp. An194]|uniref:LacI family DNA-binding transcriptional regulator n=1 Tax=Gemmiger sp. An194 TaxID=1965582 RepID=UPI000B39CF7A|nr:LacI family DNA-binding transcriptional regulator [Gemmiger sp. An194]OUP24384.1 hypothetical protein B5F28_07050 [Gemmiger sp. An194]